MNKSFWKTEGINIKSERKIYAKRKWEEYMDTESRELLQHEVELPVMSFNEYEKQFNDSGQIDSSSDKISLYIENDAEEFVGWINIYNINKKNGVFSFGIGIFKEFQKQKYGTKAVKIILKYCFNELRLHKCNSECIEYNKGSIKLHKKLGFKEEGRRRESVFMHGKYYDIILFGLTEGEFNK